MNATMVKLGLETEQTGGRQPLLADWRVRNVGDLNALAVEFRLNARARAAIRVEPFNGGPVRLLYDAPISAGEFREGWRFTGGDNRPAAPGVYLVSLTLDGEPAAETLLIKD